LTPKLIDRVDRIFRQSIESTGINESRISRR